MRTDGASFIPPVVAEAIGDAFDALFRNAAEWELEYEMTTMDQIENLVRGFAAARDVLAERMQRLQDEQEAAKRRLMPGIRNAVARFRETYDALHEEVAGNPQLFEKPRTRTLHGIRVGWIKQRGKLDIGDAERVVELIKKLMPEQCASLIRTSEKPDARALAELPARDLKRLGIGVTEDTDAPFVKAADSELSKLIDALLEDPEIEEVRT